MTTKKIVFSPFTRVEGDLRLGVEIADGCVTSARATGTLFRGFEQMLRGRQPRDAIVILCRICGQCGAAHSAASSAALNDAWQATRPRNALLVAAVIQATETILSHLSHFHCSFAGDLCGLPDCKHLEDRFAPIRGTSFQKALGGRRVLLGLMGLFAGKWPNTLAIQPGGVTRTLNRSELIRASGILQEFVRYLEDQMIGCRLERWLENESFEDLKKWLGQADHGASDLGAFASTALESSLQEIGRGPGRFLSTGAFALPEGATRLRAGYCGEDGRVEPFEQTHVAEEADFSWFDAEAGTGHPSATRTVPAPEKGQAYSWSKAPRYRGESVEVGPMARMIIDGDPLATDLAKEPGPSVFSRVLLRLHETLRLTRDLQGLLEQVEPGRPFYREPQAPEDAAGYALTEAPRGALGHWLRIENGRVRNYQVVTPTSWNLSPRDARGNPGPLEEALVGTPVRDPQQAVNVALVVRSYDPCLYCSVH